MKNLGLLFGLVLAASGGGIVVTGACAIDDDIAWIAGEECTGGCRVATTDSLSCDVDSSCTPAPGCPDWDCTEDGLFAGDVDVWVDGGDVVDGEDSGVPPSDCAANGGGESLAAAQTLSLDVTEAELSCCPTSSRWFRFSVAAGVRFAVDVVPYDGSEVTFLLYAEDESLLAGAEMDAEASFAAEARTGATYYLRVRSATAAMAYYALTIRTAVD
ncbi:MAG: hypothetical protein JXB32_03185 [Deltaproteobacteria bacterium]|nr:hypothetical protein [Deltaproteobacteria bacterium]